MAKSMSEGELRKMASAKRKRLPTRNTRSRTTKARSAKTPSRSKARHRGK